jgi:uncharacterized protein
MPKSMRGFASMSKEKRRAIAGKAGKKAHVLGKAHTWNKEEASKYGRRGGLKRNQPVEKLSNKAQQ